MDNLNGLTNQNSQDLKANAKILLAGKWNKCAFASLIFFLITGGVSSVPQIGSLLSLIISGPMILGFVIIFLKITNEEDFKLEDLFQGFNSFVKSLLAYLLIILFIFLWTLLLFIPGIIAGLAYFLTFYILAENPEMSANEARKKSKELMVGHKGELFGLGLSFIGWMFLCIFTLGIGFLWLVPYVNTTLALFYKKVVYLKS